MLTQAVGDSAADGLLYRLSAPDVYQALGSHSQGLTHAEAQARLAQVGPNALQEAKGKPLWRRLLANFTHVMALLLWVGGAVAFVAQMPQLGVAIWMVNVINGTFSFWQEFKAERATEALRRLLSPYATVIREGEEQRVPAATVVPGDVLVLAEGDRVAADARLAQAAELRVDESTLSGEAHPVRKTAEADLRGARPTIEYANLVFAGTSVAAGTGRAVVYATGMGTEFGKIAGYTQSVSEAPSPLQREMSRITAVITVLSVAIGGVVFALAALLTGVTLAESFIFALGMIVAFVPEGLLPTVTLSLAMGVQRMAKRHALVKRLSAVETLGSATVICTDKTGTLTQNEMTVRALWLPGAQYTVTGVGYAPEGRLERVDTDAGTTEGGRCVDGDVRELLTAAALCNNARLLPPNGDTPHWTILGDPTEAALKVAAVKGGLDLEALAAQRLRSHEIPFESRRKRMTTVHGGTAYVKGAPSEVVSLCPQARCHGTTRLLDEPMRCAIAAANDEYARAGLRVLAVATRELAQPVLDTSAETVERDLTFLGLAAMMDPPRPEVAEGVAKCHRAGVRIIMVTGDYGLTAESIARRIGILRETTPRIITGADLDHLDDAALAAALEDEVIFARVAPEDKLRVVSALQARGDIVAVTGDGVNDAPALKKADIGVAMGVAGTDVAKEAADMILTDDNFASIVNAIEEGRAVYANIKKFTTYVITSNMPEAAPFILFAFSGGRIPLALNVMHVLSVDLGTDMAPALALGAEWPEPGVMDRPPRSQRDHVLTRSLLARALLWLGLLESAGMMAAFFGFYWLNGYWGQWLDLPGSGDLYHAATAIALSAVVMGQVGNLFALRAERASVFRLPWFNNRLIWLGVGIELALILVIVYVPFVQGIIGTAAFASVYWLALALLAPALLLIEEARKWWIRRR